MRPVQWSHWHYVVIEKRLAPGWQTVVRGVTRPFTPLARAWRRRWRISSKEEVSEVNMDGVSANCVHGFGRVMLQNLESGVYPHNPRQHSLAYRQFW
jgi:hypothetical protein